MCVGLVEADAVAVMADDAADLVDAELAGGRSRSHRSPSEGSRNDGQRSRLLDRHRLRRRRPGAVYGV